MGRTLRDYQRESVDAVYADWAAEPIPTAVVLPTGCGKSTIVAQHCVDEAHRGGRTLVLGEREDWLGNILKATRELDPQVTAGWAIGSRDLMEPHRAVIGGMVQTLQSERRRLQMLKPTKVIVDECDLAVAPRYAEILKWAGTEDGTPTFGVTATMATGGRPKRGQRGLGDVWPRIAYSRDIEWAVEQGWLVPPRGKTVVTEHLNLAQAKVRAGDYVEGELGEMVTQDLPDIVAAWLEHGENRITAAYWPSVAAATAAWEAFEAAGVKSELITGNTAQAERDAMDARLGAGVTRMLHSVGTRTRGWDCPAVSCILMGRPTKSQPLYAQIIGRGLRPVPGKTDCLVLDLVGVTRVLGLASLPQLYRAAQVCDDRPPLEPVEKLERGPVRVREHLQGPRTYVDIDLFQSSSGCHWQTTRRKGRIFLAVGTGAAARLAVLWPEPDGSWTAAHCAAHGTARATTTRTARNPFDIHDLRVGVSMGEAKLVAEAWARSYGGADLARRAAGRSSYRRAAPYLLARAARFKVANAEGMSAARVEEECDRAVASSRLDLL